MNGGISCDSQFALVTSSWQEEFDRPSTAPATREVHNGIKFA